MNIKSKITLVLIAVILVFSFYTYNSKSVLSEKIVSRLDSVSNLFNNAKITDSDSKKKNDINIVMEKFLTAYYNMDYHHMDSSMNSIYKYSYFKDISIFGKTKDETSAFFNSVHEMANLKSYEILDYNFQKFRNSSSNAGTYPYYGAIVTAQISFQQQNDYLQGNSNEQKDYTFGANFIVILNEKTKAWEVAAMGPTQ